jgi:hypothetical protein
VDTSLKYHWGVDGQYNMILEYDGSNSYTPFSFMAKSSSVNTIPKITSDISKPDVKKLNDVKKVVDVKKLDEQKVKDVKKIDDKKVVDVKKAEKIKMAKERAKERAKEKAKTNAEKKSK